MLFMAMHVQRSHGSVKVAETPLRGADAVERMIVGENPPI